MGSKERRVIITFPHNTLETTIFRDPREVPRNTIPTSVQPTAFSREELLSLLDEGDDPSIVDNVISNRQIRDLYTEGLPPMPTPQPISEAVLLPSPPKGIFPSGVDEDHLCRLYAAAATSCKNLLKEEVFGVITHLQYLIKYTMI
jgi:hypothetical protein